MDTFRKWLYKPKADDKSLLARFYHADRSLTDISSELDSFDGRAEPDRCSRLVSRLRQGQDKVLSITNQIMEELLGEDRAPRAFRAKFPEEVLQENLAGQLWFGAECLAAGSTIMNREQESKDMRPLAQAVTKSLRNVRNLLRDQCLRNNVPNSQTLHLDFNDSTTEQLYESLKIFDKLFAEFELRYVSAMVQVKTKHEYEMQEFICVLFSETLQRALTVGLLEQEKVDAFDPGLMFSIPRLAIVAGLVIYNKGPLNMDMPAEQLSEMFLPYRMILIKIRDLLRKLNKNQLYQLEQLLCTNEDIHLKNVVNNNSESNDNESKNPINNNNCDDAATTSSSSILMSTKNDFGIQKEEVAASAAELKEDEQNAAQVNNNNAKLFNDENGVFANNNVFAMSSSSKASTPSVSPSPSPLPSTSSTTSSAEWTDDEASGMPQNGDIVSADCATGYLIPNTNLGNLLQSNEVPLTDNFIASEDDEFGSCNADEDGDLPEANREINGNIPSCSRILSTTIVDSSEESDQLTIKGTEGKSIDSRDGRYVKLEKSSDTSNSVDEVSGRLSHRHHHHHHHNHRHHHHHHHHHHHRNVNSHNNAGTSSSASSSASSSSSANSSGSSASDGNHHHSKKCSKNSSGAIVCDTSSGDTTSSLSDGDPHEVSLALRAAGRIKFISTEYLLHRLFVSIASVADQLQTNFASDLRQILRSVFLMNMSPSQDEIEIPEKNTKDSTTELFEFRASENDVIQQQSAGSNQSIYSAEEVNPELDNVFSNNTNGGEHPPAIQRGHTIDLASTENPHPIPCRNNIGRSRSLGEDTPAKVSPNTSQRRNGTLSSYLRERRLSSESHSPANSSSSTASNSPISERSAAHYTAVANNNLNNNTNHSNNSIISNNNNHSNNNSMDVPVSSPSPQIRLSPPVWVPDDKAPRCMSCTAPFTAFRRRHHCRNCGGVFCGVCSSSSTPLPKFGLTKAVRVCRDCFVHQLTA